MNSESLMGKTAIVTGAGRGIGRRIAQRLADMGVRVALAARSREQLDVVQSEITQQGGCAVAMPTDMAQEQEVVALVRRTVSEFGRLDIVVNNAGIGVFRPLADMTTDDWDAIMSVNVRGPFILCREAIPHLRQQDHTFIVNIVSVAGVKGYEDQTAYSASKHALLGMTKALARELQRDGIRVHAVCPGGVDTEMGRFARPDLDPAILMKSEEIADVVLYLLTRRGNAVIDEIHLRRNSSTPWG
jgi:3-oxoacyl-[acyl-carrier protein] reductase